MNSITGAALPVQLALQGGGAKIIGLVAALEAVENLQKEGVLRVTRIAGTSAGAIAGAMFATGVHMQTLKEKLRDTNLDAFRMPGRFGVAMKLARGKPLLDQALLKEQVMTLLGNLQKQDMNMKEFAKPPNIPMHITATNVLWSRPHNWGPNDDRQLVTAILDSAAVPFVFRMPSGSEDVVADGGICDNLPTSVLKEFVPSSGSIAAVSFARSKSRRKSPRTIFEYGLALASAAIDHSVSRSKEGLDGCVLELDLDLDTFDFERAWKEGFDRYDLIKTQARSFFEKYVAEQRQLRPPARSHKLGDVWDASVNADNLWENEYSASMAQVGLMYEAHHKRTPVRFLESKFEVIAHSLYPHKEPKPDEIKHTVKLAALSEPVFGHRFAISSAKHRTSLVSSEVEIAGSTVDSVRVLRLPLVDPGKEPAKGRALFVAFDPVLKPNDGNYTVGFHDEVVGFLEPLKNDGEDELYLTTNEFAVEKAEIVLHYPRMFGLTLDGIARSNGGSASVVNCGCRKMSKTELIPFRASAPKGFDTAGWACENVPASTRFTVKLFASHQRPPDQSWPANPHVTNT